jgi:HSP20 family molecular chaperone IbpA
MSDPQATTARAAESSREMPSFVPPADIFDTDKAIVMLLDIPGADPASVDVALDKRVLTASAHSQPVQPENYTLLHSEYADGNYERAFTLSDAVDGERIEATIKDGVLRLVLPKTAPSRAKKIAVKPA